MAKYEYQVSESANADRKYCKDYLEAVALAKELSHKQPHPVYIDVFDEDYDELVDYWYTVTKGKVERHA